MGKYKYKQCGHTGEMSKTINISYDRAAEILIDFIEECDVDELAHIFSEVFGYDITIDENEDFVCTPNKYCGFILGKEDEQCHI